MFKHLTKITAITVLLGQLLAPTQVSAFSMTPRTPLKIDITRDPISGIIIREVITPVGDTKYQIETTQAQLDTARDLIKVIVSIVDKVDIFKQIKGLFSSFSDTSGIFDIQQVPVGLDLFQLELTPIAGPIDEPSVLGDFTFEFEVDPADFGNSGFVSFEFIGSEASETDLLLITTVPEPTSTLSLLALAALAAGSTLKRQLKPSKSSEKETTKVG